MLPSLSTLNKEWSPLLEDKEYVPALRSLPAKPVMLFEGLAFTWLDSAAVSVCEDTSVSVIVNFTASVMSNPRWYIRH